MSDDESRAEPVHEEKAPVQEISHSRPIPADTNEARKAMEEATRRKQERMAEEMAEYEEARRAERGKELEELENLRIKREQRKLDRQKEDGRLAEMREQEDKRQRAEQEERKRNKMEEELKKKEEKDRKRKEAESRSAFVKGQSGSHKNFIITKREGDGVDLDQMNLGDEHYQKSREQLEEEKRAVLAQRIQTLDVENMNQDKLNEKARQLHDKLKQLEADKYDLEQRFKRQQYDMIELAERSRQMKKGKSKRAEVQVDESFDRLSDKYTSAPPKIQLCSKYERITDRRTFGDSRNLFEELCKEPTAVEIKKVNPAGEPAAEGQTETPAAE